jgi:hypothetical protein
MLNGRIPLGGNEKPLPAQKLAALIRMIADFDVFAIQ